MIQAATVASDDGGGGGGGGECAFIHTRPFAPFVRADFKRFQLWYIDRLAFWCLFVAMHINLRNF